ncbi:alcohol dehydrogenase catalytic domain-containing protein [Pseudonocardia sp. GCM10023141]|uniref:alcohol dehydrogenase catalytic domain-containing protein n=1 Tax=Pseudonocardia sp. GCM10023141 TaxID=3252653 RepID=UPI003619A9E0
MCATDIHLAAGDVTSQQAAAQLPVILGHEMVGEVVATTGSTGTRSVSRSPRAHRDIKLALAMV